MVELMLLALTRNNMNDFHFGSEWFWNAIVTVVGIISSSCGFIIKRLFGRIDALERRVEEVEEDNANIKVKVAEDYPKKEDFREFKLEVHQVLTHLLTPMNNKLDSIEEHLRNPSKIENEAKQPPI